MGNLINRLKSAKQALAAQVNSTTPAAPTPALAIDKSQLLFSQCLPFNSDQLVEEDEELLEELMRITEAEEKEGQTNNNEDQQPEGKRDENLSPEMEALLRRRPGYAYFTADFVFTRRKPIGMTLTTLRGQNRVIVTALKPDGITIEKLQLLDRCLAVNDQPVFSKYMANRLILTGQMSDYKFNLTIERPLTDEAKKEFQQEDGTATSGGNNPAVAEEGNKPENANISPKMEALLWRGTGYEYFTVDFDWESNKEKPLGMDLKNSRRRVIVARLTPSGIVSEKLQPFDRIVAVNDQLVYNTFLAQGLILKTRGKFTLTIERPLTDEAKKSFRKFDRNQFATYTGSLAHLRKFC